MDIKILKRIAFLWGMICLVGCQRVGNEATATSPGLGAGSPTNPSATEIIQPTLSSTNTPQPTDEPTPETATANAANADVLFVQARQTAKDTWTFNVTVAHPDNGWDDYADGWDVVLPDGTVIKPDAGSPFTRLLLHPHDTEQPFSRSQSGIIIPMDVTQVTVRAHDLVDGFGGQEVVVDLTADSGDNFSIDR
jgi:hypothetical protein